MKFIVGTKEYMTQVFDEMGVVHPVTVVSADPIVVTQVKNKERDGYHAVQFGVGSRKASAAKKAEAGHTKQALEAAKRNDAFAGLCEYRPKRGSLPEVNVGDTVDVSAFAEGDEVVVTAISKGKGFQGVVKRHGFAGQDRTHGIKHAHREPGSIGATGPQEVRKGTRMAGRMGGNRVAVKNLTIVGVDTENNQLLIEGAVPGHKGSSVEIYALNEAAV